jgi:tetratricopeptide (TPR) repeat protein
MQKIKYELPFVLVLITLFYLTTLQFDFVWDDKLLILDNPIMDQKINFTEIFSQSLWKLSQTKIESTFYYRPIVMLFNIIQFKIFGPSPFGFHFLNLILHLSIVSMIWILGSYWGLSKNAQILSCLIFGIHPVQSVTVSYISCQGDLLAVLFSLISILMWIHLKKHRWLALFFAFVGMLSKEIAVITPLLMISHDLIFHRRNWKNISSYVPFILYLIYFPMRWIAIESSHLSTGISQLLHSPGSFRILRFIGRIFIPIPISPKENLSATSFWILILSHVSLFLLLAVAYIKIKLKENPLIVFILIWFFLGLLPIADYTNLLIRFSDQLMYFSMVPASILIAYLISNIGRNLIIAFSVLLIFTPISYSQMSHWKTDLTLWKRIMSFDQKNIENQLQYASILKEFGMEKEGCNQLFEVQKKIKTHKNVFTHRALFHNLGNCYLGSQPEIAEKYYLESLKLAEKDGWSTRINLIIAQIDIGKNKEALNQAEILIKEKSELALSWKILGNVQRKNNLDAQSLKSYQKSLELNPEDSEIKSILLQIKNPQ